MPVFGDTGAYGEVEPGGSPRGAHDDQARARRRFVGFARIVLAAAANESVPVRAPTASKRHDAATLTVRSAPVSTAIRATNETRAIHD